MRKVGYALKTKPAHRSFQDTFAFAKMGTQKFSDIPFRNRPPLSSYRLLNECKSKLGTEKYVKETVMFFIPVYQPGEDDKPAEVAEGTEDKDSDVPICRALLGGGVLLYVVAAQGAAERCRWTVPPCLQPVFRGTR